MLADLLGDGKTVLIWHHDIEQADAEFILVEFVDGGLAIGAQYYVIPGVDQVIFDDVTQGEVIFCQQHFYFGDLLHSG